MALLVECPQCKRRNPQKEKACKGCGFLLAKHSGRVWWIDYRVDGKRERERIGPNKAAAEQRYREVKSLIAEGRYIKKSLEARTTFKALAQWYLNLPEVKAKRSYKRDKELLAKLLPHQGDFLLKDIAPAMVEEYKQKRLADPSGRTPDKLTAPATVNREVTLLKTVFNKAIRNEKAERNPAQLVRLLKENNERNRLLSPDEYIRLLAASSEQIKPIIKVAFYTGMRQGEILNLTWGQVDIKKGFITLRPEDTKTNEGRLIPLALELVEMFKAMPRGLPSVRVFQYKGKAFGSTFQKAFNTA
jgi:integrase